MLERISNALFGYTSAKRLTVFWVRFKYEMPDSKCRVSEVIIVDLIDYPLVDF